MFQKSLLKNFIKSFNAPDSTEIINLITKDKFIAEDANGAEFITLISSNDLPPLWSISKSGCIISNGWYEWLLFGSGKYLLHILSSLIALKKLSK